MRQARQLHPFRQQQRCGNVPMLLFVARLLNFGGPPQIARLIVPVHVNAIKRMLRGRSSSYTIQKILIGIKSTFDTATPIIGEFGITGIGATTFSAHIGLILRRLFTFAVNAIAPYGFIRTIASARHKIFYSERCAAGTHERSTITQTVPHSDACVLASIAENEQPSKTLSGQQFNAITVTLVYARIYSKIVGSHCSKDNSFVNLVRAAREASTLAWPVPILA